MKKLALHWRILIGLGLGIGVGMVLNQYGEQVREALPAGAVNAAVNLNRVLGELFKRALQFIAAPIIMLAMILAVNSIGDLKKLGR